MDFFKTTAVVRTLLASQTNEAQLNQVFLIPPDAIPPYVEKAVIAVSRIPQKYRRTLLHQKYRRTLLHPSGTRLANELARLLLPREDRPYSRMAEIGILSQNIEFSLSREEMISAWLATSYFRKHTYGATATAELYFNKPLAELNVCEAILLAITPYTPSYIIRPHWQSRSCQRAPAGSIE